MLVVKIPIVVVLLLTNVHRGRGLEQSPNFVFILTDDQDLILDGLLPMKETLKLIANNGATFTNAFVNTPICCPSRSTILTGLYPHNHGVKNNSIVNGNCSSGEWQTNFEPKSVAALLKLKKNYTNFYAGKYLNKYGSKKAGGLRHIPQGYDWWLGLDGNSVYYNYSLSINGTRKFFDDYYLTDNIADNVLEFLNQNFIKTRPFFIMLAPPACHSPFTPAPRHTKTFPGIKVKRTPSFNYSANDKHWLMGIPPKFLPTNLTKKLDEITRLRLQTLLSVDEMIEKVISRLENLEILNQTYLIFSSDNGFHIGQFTQPWDKRQLYETDIRVPFLISGPRIPTKISTNFPISTVDITPTILDLAGIDLNGLEEFDGKSFKNQLFNPSGSKDNSGIIHDNSIENEKSEDFVLIEYWGEGSRETIDQFCWDQIHDSNLAECIEDNWCKCQDSRNNTYSCLIHFIDNQAIIKFCQFDDPLNFIEVYNLEQDPYELENIFKNMSKIKVIYYQTILNRLINCNGLNCRNKDYLI